LDCSFDLTEVDSSARVRVQLYLSMIKNQTAVRTTNKLQFVEVHQIEPHPSPG